MKRQLCIIGSSHASHLTKATFKSKLIQTKFNISNSCKPGAVYTQTYFPMQYLLNLNQNDIIILQLFGNDLMKRNIKIEKTGYKKIIHLTCFQPNNEDYMLNLYKDLQNKLKNVKAKILLLDNNIRYAFCCNKHIHKGLLMFQNKQNRIMRNYFEKTNIKVIRHEQIIQKAFKYKIDYYNKKRKEYFELFSDTVHYHQGIYPKIIQTLLDEYDR